MDTIIKIVVCAAIIMLSLAILASLFMGWNTDRIARYYGALRKPEKENIVRNVRIDNVEDK